MRLEIKRGFFLPYHKRNLITDFLNDEVEALFYLIKQIETAVLFIKNGRCLMIEIYCNQVFFR